MSIFPETDNTYEQLQKLLKEDDAHLKNDPIMKPEEPEHQPAVIAKPKNPYDVLVPHFQKLIEKKNSSEKPKIVRRPPSVAIQYQGTHQNCYFIVP